MVNHNFNLYNSFQMLNSKIKSFPTTFLMLIALLIFSPMACVDLEFDQPPGGELIRIFR